MRIVEDAITCIDNVDFMGPRSKMTNTGENNYCTMPIKVTFSDRDSRINFERCMRENTGLRASQSLPQPIRKEMALFRKALEDRYQGHIIMTRPDTRNLEFISFRKVDGDKKWTPCVETHAIPLGIMLPGFRESTSVRLQDVDSQMEEGELAAGGGD
jgi:hypothetical protein